MTEPKRWSHSGSEVDPVLRSVARYAQDLKPSDAALQRLLNATAKPRHSRPNLRRFTVAVALGMAAAFGGVAFASYGTTWLRSFQSPTVAPRPAAPRKAEPRAVAPPPQPAAAPSIVAPPEPSAALAPRLTPPAPAEMPGASVATDAELLQRARAALANSPVLALALTREHAARFSSSPLTEERQALSIEALARLGRRSEARQGLSAFEETFPRSPYRRRLRALVAP
jgi:hypothetical protein